MIYEKILKCVKLSDNIIKCYDYKNESSDYGFSITESFFYEQKTEKRFRIQADIYTFGKMTIISILIMIIIILKK